ncbi:hypothetical protein TIFTF001_029188 [Ficus carica]|uniref:C2H2-type domain-containing protein n=1 Tax=Ficus carica TaxID=3494 RepID=A0AA88J326_FICCA|nr:hypothetical protein TIFTF001_029188 [Ficus carica]
MEEARHWVWAKRKHGLISTSDDLRVRNKASMSYDDSWEEQAFAEDASGPLGGCIWPPRSYSCSFCRREFRSAQALGGHMNVHRRDRARLKQSPPELHREILHQNHHHHHLNNIPVQNINPLIRSFGPTQYPSHQVCALVYNPNPNSDYDPTNPSYFSSSILQENNQKKIRSSSSISPSSQSWSNLATDRDNHSSNQKNLGEKISSITHVESGSCRAKGDYHVKTDLSVSLNLVVCHSCPTVSGGKEETVSCKRRRTTESSLPPSPSLKPSSVDSHDRAAQSELAYERSPCSVEDLDLELRLGVRSTL